MANFTSSVSIVTPQETVSASKSGQYKEVFKATQELHAGLSHNTFMTMLKTSTTSAQSAVKNAKAIMIKNTGIVSYFSSKYGICF